MPLSTTVRRHALQPHRVVFLSAGISFLSFLLFIVISVAVTCHQRAEAHNQLIGQTRSYVIRVMDELKQILLPLQAETFDHCDRVRDDLAEQAASTPNIRYILLVNNNAAFCSSASGPMNNEIHQISPFTNDNKAVDIRLVSGAPMLRGKPAMVLWLRNPTTPGNGVLATLNLNMTPYLLLASQQRENTGMAIVTGDTAITTWNEQVINTDALPPNPLRRIAIPGYPMMLYFYGEILPERDLHIIIMAGLLVAVLVASICYVLFRLRLRPGKEIMQGIRRGEFHVEYQPIIATGSDTAYGLEALMRWVHPTEGRVPADAFISYAEGQNLIVPLTRHLFALIARDAHQLCKVVPVGTKLGINLSPSHLTNPDFRKDVRQWLAMMPVDHFEYVFEITERTMVSESNADEMFDWIHQQNIKIAIDDFGTGHSALLYLEKFHFDYLKIDRGFVQSIGMKTVTSPVLDTVLTLARELKLKTVAEGVETNAQAQWLINRGVTHLQGYFYSRPLGVQQLAKYFSGSQPASEDCADISGSIAPVKTGK
ncbi:cyclic di-GMP phosphodiesterase [Erwinia tasmaniensis]|uniref:cyclic-guanylate-specific phosphodiesterase n=1 Tax=Erwinia tasmaniensis (strain DSM 17950 / CFBP 7177 / CIP 109463 / NCPPB 4357 / Et1/99) TaxID=465817 RepID=B2VIJ7_ERWT9|nr:cyclic di-GMP phosphodiesterase [Erwinia tasmaniensis]CAO96315.1 Rtn protein [Erwinia tasmaniensis Et1/99]